MSINFDRKGEEVCCIYKGNVRIKRLFYTDKEIKPTKEWNCKGVKMSLENGTFTVPAGCKLRIRPYERMRMVVMGNKGGGVNSYVNELIHEFMTNYKHDQEIIFSFDGDGVKVTLKQLNENIENGKPIIELDTLNNTLCIFKDVLFNKETILSKFYSSMISAISDRIVEDRQFNCSYICVIYWNRNRYLTDVLNSCSHLVMFNNSANTINNRILKYHYKFNDEVINKILSLRNTRYIIIRKMGEKHIILTEECIFSV